MQDTPATDTQVELRKKLGRRALLTAGGTVVAAGIIVAEAPLAAHYGRRLLAEEIANLEGIALDDASKAADITAQAVEVIVMPIASALSGLSIDSLNAIAAGIDAVEKIPGIDPTALNALKGILAGWKQNVALFPATIKTLNETNRDAGKKYLASLKAKQQHDAANVV